MVQMWLKREEKELLYKKYVKKGMSTITASNKLKEMEKKLHTLVLKLLQKNVPENKINEKFKKKFEELCMKIDGEY